MTVTQFEIECAKRDIHPAFALEKITKEHTDKEIIKILNEEC